MNIEQTGKSKTHLSENDFRYLKNAVLMHSGICLDESKKTYIFHRLKLSMEVSGHNDINKYFRDLNADGSGRLIRNLVESITVNETYFFRESAHFDYLRDDVFPNAVKLKGRALNIWCAACSTGQEVYSIAMAAEEYRERTQCESLNIDIFATDISSGAIQAAKLGIYSGVATRGLTPEYQKKYFISVETGLKIRDELKRNVTFSVMNLLDERPRLKQDIIFCRNVLIYFNAETKRTVLSRLCSSLRENGCLITGMAEPMKKMPDGFVTVRSGASSVYMKKAADS